MSLGLSPSWQSAPPAPKQSSPFAPRSPQAEPRLFGLPGKGWGSWGGDDNCCEMSHLLIAENHSPHLCYYPIPGTRGAEIPVLWGPCPSWSCSFSACIMQEWSWWPALPFPLFKPFLAAVESGESKKRFVWGKRLKEETLLQKWLGSNSLGVSG